ncbi:MAG: 30S ribosome-binding factor RbfA, partial [Kofleriaceae bacterium]
MPVNQRKSRVEHAMRDVLTELIATEVKDPRVRAATLLTVTKVEMNVDLAVANVYISVIGDDATADGVIAGLTKAAGFLRGPVARQLALQRAPELRFAQDVTVDVSAKLAAILREDEEKANAVGRVAGQAQPEPVDKDPEPPAEGERGRPAESSARGEG